MKKIMVVDDEQNIRDLLKEKLERSGYSVMAASSGEEAISISRTDVPQLLLVDIAMPGLDGYQTCEKLRQDNKTKGIPVLFLTGKDLAPEGVMEHCRELGVRGHVSKLTTLKELLGKIEEVIGGP